MMTSILQGVSYLCSYRGIYTTHLASGAWATYYRDLGFEVGSVTIENLALNYWIIKTKVGGNILVFSHVPKLLFMECDKKQGFCKFDLDKTKKFFKILHNKIVPILTKYRITAVKLVPFHCKNKQFQKIFKAFGYIRSPKTYEMASWHAYIPFIKYVDINELLSSFRKTTRYEIRKSAKYINVTIKQLCQMNEQEKEKFLKTFYDYYYNFTQRFTKHIPMEKRNFFMLINNIEKDDKIDALFINSIEKESNKVVGVSMFILYARNMYYFLSAANKVSKKVSGLYSNVYEAIKWGMANNYLGLSLWGVNIDSKLAIKDWKGFSFFKKGFKPEVAQLMGPYIRIIRPRGVIFLIREYLAHLMVKYRNAAR